VLVKGDDDELQYNRIVWRSTAVDLQYMELLIGSGLKIHVGWH
jgi:hypothetical protein